MSESKYYLSRGNAFINGIASYVNDTGIHMITSTDSITNMLYKPISEYGMAIVFGNQPQICITFMRMCFSIYLLQIHE